MDFIFIKKEKRLTELSIHIKGPQGNKYQFSQKSNLILILLSETYVFISYPTIGPWLIIEKESITSQIQFLWFKKKKKTFNSWKGKGWKDNEVFSV